MTVAAAQGDLAKVRQLIAAKADLNVYSQEGGTALMYAAIKGHADVVKALLDAGADCKAAMSKPPKWTALIGAADQGHAEVVKMLLEKGSEVNAADVYGNTAISGAALKGRTEVVGLLLKAGARTEVCDTRSGNTPLLAACSKGHCETAVKLIEGGADVNRADTAGMTPLMVASAYNRADLVKGLLGKKANVNARMADTARIAPGTTALMQAAAKGNVEIVRLLMQNGADIAIKDVGGEDAMAAAERNGKSDVVRVLRGGPESNPAPATPGPAVVTEVNAVSSAGGTLIGKTEDEVVLLLGKPTSSFSAKGKKTMFYKDRELELQDGKVVTEQRK